MLVFEAADAEHEIDGPGAVDDEGGLGEQFLEDYFGAAKVFSARSLVKAVSFAVDGVLRLRCWRHCNIRERVPSPPGEAAHSVDVGAVEELG